MEMHGTNTRRQYLSDHKLSVINHANYCVTVNATVLYCIVAVNKYVYQVVLSIIVTPFNVNVSLSGLTYIHC